MGANASKSVQNFNNLVQNQLDASSIATSDAQCKIDGVKLKVDNFENCSFKNVNKCSSNSVAQLDALAQAASKMYAQASKQQQTSIGLPGVNADSSEQEINNAIRNELKAKCESNASVRNEILNTDFTIGNCKDSELINFNLGNATGNCGVKLVQKTIADTTGAIETKQTTGLDPTMIMIIVAVIFVILIIGGIIIVPMML